MSESQPTAGSTTVPNAPRSTTEVVIPVTQTSAIGTTPFCPQCGRPVVGAFVPVNSGCYHPECVGPPPAERELTALRAENADLQNRLHRLAAASSAFCLDPRNVPASEVLQARQAAELFSMENAALRADLARVTAERDALRKDRELVNAVRQLVSLPNWRNRGPEWKDIDAAFAAIDAALSAEKEQP